MDHSGAGPKHSMDVLGRKLMSAQSLDREIRSGGDRMGRVEERMKSPVHAATRSTARPANVGPARSLELEYKWIGEHSHEHSGDWVALLGDRLLIAAPRLDDI